MKFKIFVIIVTYKGKQWYDRCFSSLRQSTIPVQTIVVDNSHGVEDAEYIMSHFPEVHLIKTEENLGFGRANNIGMRYALDHGCDYVFLLNQDAWIDSDCIEKLIDIHQSHPDFGILSPMHLEKDKKHLNILVDDGHNNYELLSDSYCKCLKDYYTVQYVNAAAWLLPRHTLETVGGFDPLFKHYEEDDDYIQRILYHQLDIVLCPKACVIHDHTTLTNTLTNREDRRLQMSLLKHTDLRRPLHLYLYLLYLLRKMVVCICKHDKRQVRNYWHEFHFLVRKRNDIKLSRTQNMKKTTSWL